MQYLNKPTRRVQGWLRALHEAWNNYICRTSPSQGNRFAARSRSLNDVARKKWRTRQKRGDFFAKALSMHCENLCPGKTPLDYQRWRNRKLYPVRRDPRPGYLSKDKPRGVRGYRMFKTVSSMRRRCFQTTRSEMKCYTSPRVFLQLLRKAYKGLPETVTLIKVT